MQASAQWIAEAVSGRLVGNDVPVTGPVVTDSREAQAGSLYVARRGESADGHAFVSGAATRGAVAVIVEHEVDEAVTQIVVEDSTEALGGAGPRTRREAAQWRRPRCHRDDRLRG